MGTTTGFAASSFATASPAPGPAAPPAAPEIEMRAFLDGGTFAAPSPVPAEPSKTEEAQRQIAQPKPKPKRSRVKRRRARKKRAKRPRKAVIKEIEPPKLVPPKQVIAQVQPQAASQESPADSAPSTQRDDESKAPISATSATSTPSSASHGDGSSGQPAKRRLSRSQLRGIAKGYYRSLNILMKQKRVYPRSARRLKLEGTVLVEMVINREGEIIKVKIARSSGHELLDKAAIAQVQKLRRVPKIPRELNRPSMTFKIPFDYRLQS